MSTIVLSGLLAASDEDILQGTRLQTLMEGGMLTVEVGGSDCVAANHYLMSLQLPNGKTPMNGVMVPQTSEVAGTGGTLDDRKTLRFRTTIGKGGGHPVFGLVEVGDTEAIWRVTYQDSR